MKTYVLIVSQRFPGYHPRKGESTDFLFKITEEPPTKIHTLRKNWELWKRRIQAVNDGKAVLSVRYWSGKPYRTPQVELIQLKGDEVGFQKLQRWYPSYYLIDDIDSEVTTLQLAKNDGLETVDFLNWFNSTLDPLGIIHFTKFRYKNSSCS